MSPYDCICILGYAFDHNYKLPPHIYPRIIKTAELFHRGVAPYIAVCGKWTLARDLQLPLPPATEAEEMKKMLVEQGVPESRIIKEEESKDTIANAYFFKTKIVIPHNFRNILVVCANYHVGRASFIFNKVFGDEYTIYFLSSPTGLMKDTVFLEQQNQLFLAQQQFLKNMKEGDHEYLKDKLYEFHTLRKK